MNNSTTNKNIETQNQTNLDWSLIQSQMKNKLGIEIFESWLKKINFVEEFNNYILLTVPTRFIRDWITSRYLDQILQIIRSHKKDIIRIEFKIADLKTSNEDNKKEIVRDANDEKNVSFIKDSYLQYNRIDPNKRFDNFLTGSSNKLAYEASIKVSENISHYNPLYIYGGVGMGKTHLLNSIGLELKKNNKVCLFLLRDLCINLLNQLKQMIWLNLKNILEIQTYY